MMQRTLYSARTFLITTFIGFPVIAPCETVQTFRDQVTGISVMVPSGYLASSNSQKDNLTIRLASKDSIINYCDLSFSRTTVPDKWAHDKTKRTLHERFRTVEATEKISVGENRRVGWFIDAKGEALLEPFPPPPIESKILKVQLRAIFNYVSITCSAKIDDYDKRRPIFEAVIKSIDIPY
jgi:hypothetical protein